MKRASNIGRKKLRRRSGSRKTESSFKKMGCHLYEKVQEEFDIFCVVFLKDCSIFAILRVFIYNV